MGEAFHNCILNAYLVNHSIPLDHATRGEEGDEGGKERYVALSGNQTYKKTQNAAKCALDGEAASPSVVVHSTCCKRSRHLVSLTYFILLTT